MLLYILIFVYLVGLSTIYTYFEEKKDEIKLLTIPQIVDKTTKISMNILMFWSFFKKNKPYD